MSVDLVVELDARINFAMQQNDVPVIKYIRVQNRAAEVLRDVTVRVTAEPLFAKEWTTKIAAIKGESTYQLNGVDLELSPGFLRELTERMEGRLLIDVHGEEETLAEITKPVTLLARDEWGGLSSLPEILAAFVVPNNPAIDRVLKGAAEFLGTWTGSPSLNGYQTKDRQRAYQLAAATYASLSKQELTYVNPPASFEEEGQRVRLPDRILQTRLATCLDVALLAAGCLEQAGLHPVVVLVEGHALAGAWLDEASFAQPAEMDPLPLRKRVELHEIVVFDPTGVTSRPQHDFEQAVAEANRRLEDAARFLCTIDIKRARKGQVRPLPELIEQFGDPAVVEEETVGGPQGSSAPDVTAVVEPPPEEPTSDAETPATRLDRWQRKLLDLTLRNRLLNFKETKKTLQLQCPDKSRVEDMLAEGTSFEILPRPSDLGQGDPRDAEAYRRRTGQKALDGVLLEELEAKRLRSSADEKDLDRRLVEIYRAARVALEEGGASGLFLAVGFLAWYETETSTQRRLAPILLLPLELHRKSARQGFTLRLGDDEPRANVTLLELLKRDHGLEVGGLDPLPEDESGLDVQRILDAVRLAVRDIDRWEVVDDLRIGMFSFVKFLMWRDLTERTDELLRNGVVDHLVNRPNEVFDSGWTAPSLERQDDKHPPTGTFCPLPADSSQLAAVYTAADGKSFVLEGPPGTGKSQTIANLIAHCLTEGKKVLFVSEKMAALNVVHRRLEQVGLGRFCLELHSNKAHKREVIEQLGKSFEHIEELSTEEWERQAQAVVELRAHLNAYASALHARRSTGETVFQATSSLIGLRDVFAVRLGWPDSDEPDEDHLAELRDVVESLAIAAKATGDVHDHPWRGVQRENWTPGWQTDVASGLSSLSERTKEADRAAASASERLSLEQGAWSLKDLSLIREVTALFMESPGPPSPLLVRPDWEDIQILVKSWIEHGRERDSVRSNLLKDYDDSITGLDLDDLRRKLTVADAAWWPASWWGSRPVRKALRGVAKSGRPPAKNAGGVLDDAIKLRAEQRVLDEASPQANELLGRHWNNTNADWDAVAQLLDWVNKVRAHALSLAHDEFDQAGRHREAWARLLSEGQDLLTPEGSAGKQFLRFREAHVSFLDARAGVAELLNLDVASVWGSLSTLDALGLVGASVDRWLAAMNQLREWCGWRRARMEAKRQALGPIVDAFEEGSIRSVQIRSAFERAYADWWIGKITDREPVLNQFYSPEHQRKIEQFRAVDDRYTAFTRRLIHSRLAARLPNSNAGNLPNSEMGILRREVGKRRRHMSVRQLFQKIPNLLPRLKPCLLMSPMSVAQYLDSKHPAFDIVVFDEASQIPIWDAVGAIARGRQAVIVGDPKQLPPTSFFQRLDDEEESVGDDVVEDLESILDDCKTSGIPWLPLDWHYRSRHESLITFSNFHYYKNRLLTFPSPIREGMGVSWRHVADGIYDRGKSSTNRAEADAIIDDVVARLRDPLRRDHSIGVVTFSQAQQTLIEDLLDERRASDPEIEQFFSEAAVEPVFVKNLENVQGDERDVILFSICYGPDRQGKVSMNFGPMNREGGERRLNVAVTRARREVTVFSTLRADQIDLSRTRARGVADLKAFLMYAEHGSSTLGALPEHDPGADFESPFEEAVYDELAKLGWTVHKQVGTARYRIDLGVVDPEAPGRYLLGVECDGANYHRAKTARDRDKLRAAVLKDLGWTLHRVWSTDWWTNPAREVEKLQDALNMAGQARRSENDNGPRQEDVEDAVDEEPPQPEPQEAAEPDQALLEDPEFQVYQPISTIHKVGSMEGFYSPAVDRLIKQKIVAVVRKEGPISLGLAARRVAAFWGFERVRPPAVERVTQLLRSSEVDRVRGYLWPKGVGPAHYLQFRIPGTSAQSQRQATDLPPEEIANGAFHILENEMSAPEDELVRETARLFGFQRLGTSVDRCIRKGIATLVRSGRARRDGDRLVVVT